MAIVAEPETAIAKIAAPDINLSILISPLPVACPASVGRIAVSGDSRIPDCCTYFQNARLARIRSQLETAPGTGFGGRGMARIKLRGMTWGHRRAVDPLLATKALFEKQHPEIEIEWASRPLHGFEFTPVPDLAKEYDLIVLDHPFCGEIAATRCLLPVDEVIAAAGGDRYVGPSVASYTYAGACWAVPIDAACQVAVSRPDLLQALDRPAPHDWAALIALGETAGRRGLKLAICLRGVHSLMTFFSLAANLGKPCATDPAQPLIERDTARDVLQRMRALLALCPRESLDWNSIELHDVMVARDD